MNLLDLGYILAAGLTAPWWARKKRHGWRERMGHIEGMVRADSGDRPTLLLHAVSVGEVNALRPLVPLLTHGARVVVSTTTDTGLARAREAFGDTCVVVRYPLDASAAVRRFLDLVEPDAVALVELELWPNFLAACRKRNIPVGVINGRLSARSFRGYRRFRWAVGGMFRGLEFAWVQDEAYAERFVEMGVPKDRLRVTGSMKWDSIAVAACTEPGERAVEIAAALGIDRSRPLVVAGSTGPGEEAMLHKACPSGVQLLCAPRKPERFGEAAAALPGSVRRSEPGSGDPGADRFLLDSIGELGAIYALADVVVLGRSFLGMHGSDPAEPAGLGRPLLIGPFHSDFETAVRALRGSGALEVVDADGVGSVLGRILGDEAARDAMGSAARECVLEHQGAAALHAELLLGLTRPGSGSAG